MHTHRPTTTHRKRALSQTNACMRTERDTTPSTSCTTVHGEIHVPQALFSRFNRFKANSCMPLNLEEGWNSTGHVSIQTAELTNGIWRIKQLLITDPRLPPSFTSERNAASIYGAVIFPLNFRGWCAHTAYAHTHTHTPRLSLARV